MVYAYIDIFHLSKIAINCGARKRKLPIIPNASHPLRISTEGPWLVASFCLNFFSVNRRSEEAQIWENDLGERNGKAFRGPPTFHTRKFLQERRGRRSFLSLSSCRRFLPFCAKVNFSLPLLSRERKRKGKRSLCKKKYFLSRTNIGQKVGETLRRKETSISA